MSSSQICNAYIPYFNSGCNHQCKKQHLLQSIYTKYCAEINEKNPPSLIAQRAYANALDLCHQRKFHASINILNDLLKDYPLNIYYIKCIARCYERVNLFRANYYFRKVISINPTDHITHVHYANYLIRKKDYKAAKTHFKKALELNNNDSISHGMYAKYLYEIENNINKAEYHFKYSLQLNPFDERACYQYAKFLSNTNQQLFKSKCYFIECIKMDKKKQNQPFMWHYYYYALLLKKLKEYQNAYQQFIYCFELSKFNDANTAIVNYEIGLMLCENMQNYTDGIQYLCNALKYAPNNLKYVRCYNKYKNYSNNTNNDINDATTPTPPPPPRTWINNSKRLDPPIAPPPVSSSTPNGIESKTDFVHKSPPSVFASCSNEFQRWLSKKIVCDNNILNMYHSKFEKLSFNDIRLLEYFDAETLRNDIKMNQLHIKMFEKQVIKFKQECKTFNLWLKSIQCFDYSDLFETNGILTFESFYYYINNPKDLERIIGSSNKADAKYIWCKTPKYLRSLQPGYVKVANNDPNF